jgi:hypothetical protein
MFIRGEEMMKRTVEEGRTLLVDGPASFAIVSGACDVLGFQARCGCRIVVRDGKRLPFFATETASMDISLGENAGVEEVDGDTIPPSWIESVELLASCEKNPAVAMVIGKGDSGKTSLCTYLINKLTQKKRRIAVLDGDLGQSDVGPPCTVAYAHVSKPVTDLFMLKAMATLLGFFLFAGVVGLYSVLAKVYPTRLRATGVGFCYNTARYLAAFAPGLPHRRGSGDPARATGTEIRLKPDCERMLRAGQCAGRRSS